MVWGKVEKTADRELQEGERKTAWATVLPGGGGEEFIVMALRGWFLSYEAAPSQTIGMKNIYLYTPKV